MESFEVALADLPRIWARTEVPSGALPRVSPNAVGGQIFEQVSEGLSGLAEIGRKQQQVVDFDKASSEYRLAMDEFKRTLPEEDDTARWEGQYGRFEKDTKARVLKSITDSETRRLLESQFQRDSVRDTIDVRAKAQEMGARQRVAYLDRAEDELSEQAAKAETPEQREELVGRFHGLIASQSVGPGQLITDGEKRKKRFEQKIDVTRADMMIRGDDPANFLRAWRDGEFTSLDTDTLTKLGEQARTRIHQQDVARERAVKQVKDMVDDKMSALANQGAIPESDLQDMLNDKHPYIKPDRARTLKAINDNPPTGEGGTQVQAIMSEYYLSPRTLPHIARTRAALRSLQAQLGKPNPLISKAANELQTDQTTMENQGISREANEISRKNREIGYIKTEYDANKAEVPPFVQRLFGNHTTQDKAKIEAEYRSAGPEAARKLAESLAKGQKQKANAIPERNKKVLDLAK